MAETIQQKKIQKSVETILRLVKSHRGGWVIALNEKHFFTFFHIKF